MYSNLNPQRVDCRVDRHNSLRSNLNVGVGLKVAADGLVVAELDKTHFSQGEVRLEDTQHAVGHFGEHHSKLDGESGDPSHPEQFRK